MRDDSKPPGAQGGSSMNRPRLRLVVASAADHAPNLEADSPGEAPDVSVPFEAFVWKSDIFGGVRIDLSSIDRQFRHTALARVRAGVRGRGKAELTQDDGLLEVQFGLTDDELAAGAVLLDDYRDALLTYLGLPAEAVLDQVIAPFNVTPETRERVERAMFRYGLHAID